MNIKNLIVQDYPLYINNINLLKPISLQIYIENLNKNYTENLLNIPIELNNQIVEIYDSEKEFININFNDLLNRIIWEDPNTLNNIFSQNQRNNTSKCIIKEFLKINNFYDESGIDKWIYHLKYLKNEFVIDNPELSYIFKQIMFI